MARHTFGTVRAFLFDMDGTLVDSHEVVERCWRRWGESHNIDPEKILAYCHGRQSKATIKHFAPELNGEEETKRMLAWELQEPGGTHPIAGAIDFLKQLPRESWAVVTSASLRLAEHRLSAAGIPHPDVLIAAETVQQSKPHPEGFLLGAERLGIAAKDSLVFEDSVVGLEAGRNAHMPTLQIGAAHPPRVKESPIRALDYRSLTLTRSAKDGAPCFEVHVETE